MPANFPPKGSLSKSRIKHHPHMSQRCAGADLAPQAQHGLLTPLQSSALSCRSRQRAEQLASAADDLNVLVATLEDVQAGRVQADVLVNTTSVGMHPNVNDSPMPAESLGGYQLVFDAIYTPVQTQLLQVSRHCDSAAAMYAGPVWQRPDGANLPRVAADRGLDAVMSIPSSMCGNCSQSCSCRAAS